MARLISLPILLVIAFCVSGCSSFNPTISQLNPLQKMNAEAEKESQTPLRMAIMWKDSVIHGVGTTPTVGFGGRVFFYNMDDEAVQADGELTIYGYDEENTSTAASKKFIIRQEEFKNHYDDAGLGPSYGVWIPWQKMGSNRKSVSLIPVFKTTDGRIIRGGQSIVILPGKAPQKDQLAKTDILSSPFQEKPVLQQAFYDGTTDSKVVFAAGETPQGSSDQKSSNIKTTTISVPKDMGRRLSKLPAQTTKQAAIQPEELEKILKRFQANQNPGLRATNDAIRSNDSDQPNSLFNAPAKTAVRAPVFGQPGSLK